MAATLVGGAAVGAVFGELLMAVLEIKDKAIMFKPTLAYLQSTLVAIAPVVTEIEQHNNDLGRPKEELESLVREMQEGTKLVSKCSEIHRLNFLAKARYQEKLEALVDSLVKFFVIDMQAQSARDLKETLLKVRRIYSAVNKFPLINREDTMASSSDSVTMPVNVSEPGSMVTQQAEYAAGTNSEEQVMELITGTKQEAGQGKAKAGNDQGMKDFGSEKSYDLLRTTVKRFFGIRISKIRIFNRKVKKVTSIKQNNKLDSGDVTSIKTSNNKLDSGDVKTSYNKLESGDDKTSNNKLDNGDVKTSYNKQVRPNKLVFLDYSSYSFNLENLLRASAEVLGDGSYGITYKVTMEHGSATVIVKRLREVKITEFEKQVEMLQTLLPPHPNVCPLRAYSLCIEEKLLIYDYIAGGSFSDYMHERWRNGRTQLDWKSRMEISLGAARGIAHIHSISGMNFVHGNIKSSNVLVTPDFQGSISDFGLTRSLDPPIIPIGTKGYQAPEVIETGKLTQMSDVYSFGILLLEVLTGKPPGDPGDLASWVELQARDGLLYALLDDAIKADFGVWGMALDMMKLARACASMVPDMRPSMDEVVCEMEGLMTSN